MPLRCGPRAPGLAHGSCAESKPHGQPCHQTGLNRCLKHRRRGSLLGTSRCAVCASAFSAPVDGGSEIFEGASGSEAVASGVLEVTEALASAEQAALKAEKAVDRVRRLPSAWPDPLVVKYLKRLRDSLPTAGLLLFAILVGSHMMGAQFQFIGGFIGALLIAISQYLKRTLSMSGAIAAFFVGGATMATNCRCGATLLAFFFSSSRLTKLKQERKALLTEHKMDGQRDWKQVIANGGVPAILSCAIGVLADFKNVPLSSSWSTAVTSLLGAFLGYYACCCGDTWASEVGMLSTDTPRLITSGRPVRNGTNGGVTLLGLAASMAGGLFIGAVFYAFGLVGGAAAVSSIETPVSQWWLLPLGLLGGLAGSIIDSILGATLQFSGFNLKTQKVVNRPGHPNEVMHISGLNILSNNQVNLVSASLTALLVSKIALLIF
ncbi:unnamed protein product [Ostreobium quekettii]|uniref:Transmembrane protein 19 n=1 Tax=Ostreobium quekettii TaxID=121088 RepID=A0A8S1IMJ2_9CHLO|nr:unnamed protein product [Ostreobium quekettii]